MRRAPLGLLITAVLLAAGCGERRRTPALAPVRVTVVAPNDLAQVEASTIAVSGRVEPGDARVLVDGVEATVRGGSFSAEVALDGGANVIDVSAAAPRHPSAFSAVRVTRLIPVEIPDLEHFTPDDASDRLAGVGLKANVQHVNPIDIVLPGTVGVCGSDPPAGERVRVGTTVTLLVQKSC